MFLLKKVIVSVSPDASAALLLGSNGERLLEQTRIPLFIVEEKGSCKNFNQLLPGIGSN